MNSPYCCTFLTNLQASLKKMDPATQVTSSMRDLWVGADSTQLQQCPLITSGLPPEGESVAGWLQKINLLLITNGCNS